MYLYIHNICRSTTMVCPEYIVHISPIDISKPNPEKKEEYDSTHSDRPDESGVNDKK